MLTPQYGLGRWFKARRGTSRKVFILGYSCTQRFPHLKVPTSHLVHKSLNRILSKRPSSYKSESALYQRGPLGRTVLQRPKTECNITIPSYKTIILHLCRDFRNRAVLLCYVYITFNFELELDYLKCF